MIISIIVAIAENNVIGKKNSLPWYLPADLMHFKKTTMGHHIIMGQTTHESIGKPLPGRTNIILSKDPKFEREECIIAHSIESALNIAKKAGEKEVFIIGGSSVYNQVIGLADKIYMTKIHHDFEGDVYFPEFDLSQFKQISCEKHKQDEKNPYPYEFCIYKRI